MCVVAACKCSRAWSKRASVAALVGMMALGQLRHARKFVQSSPRRVPGARPEKGSLQENPNIETAVPDGGADTVGAGVVDDPPSADVSTWPNSALCSAAMRKLFCAATSGP